MATDESTQIKTLVLNFPNGESVKTCEKIARIAEILSSSSISSGGMSFSAISMHDDKGLDFNEDKMDFNFDYKKKKESV